MRSSHRQLLLIFAVASLLALAGCTEALQDDDDAEDIDNEELQSKAMAAMADVDSMEFEMNQTTEMASFSQDVNVSGAMNTQTERMEMTMELGNFLFDGSASAYIDGDTLYVQFNDMWLQSNVSDSDIWTYEEDQVEQQRKILNASTPEVQSTKTFEGHEVYVVEINMSDEEIDEIINQNGGESSADTGAGDGSDEADSSGDDGGIFDGEAKFDFDLQNQTEVTEASAVQYIDTESYHIRHTKLDLTTDTPFGEIKTKTRMTFDNFNESTNIELPAGTENAVAIDEYVEEFDDFDWGTGNESAGGDFDFGNDGEDEGTEA